MKHEFLATGCGPKKEDPGCTCGYEMIGIEPERVESAFIFHMNLRQWFESHPGFGNAGSYQFNFEHWKRP